MAAKLDRTHANLWSGPEIAPGERPWDGKDQPSQPLTAHGGVTYLNSDEEDRNGLSEIGLKIFLDRYALKDVTRTSLSVGDTVVVVVDTKTGQREIGTVRAMANSNVTVELLDGTIVERPAEQVDKPIEIRPEQMMDRVARGIAAVEAPEKREEWERKFRWLLNGWKFVPGGRILAAAGTNQQLTYYNCYVVSSPRDSRRGIVETLSQMMEIMSRGGGVGINVSSLRPRHSYVRGVNGRSSGAVSWGALYSFVTGLIEQGGSRRGALMLILHVWHPDVQEFITSKREMGKITNANISVGITDDFMQAVEQDQPWELVFPDTTDPEYNELWDGDLPKWRLRGKPVIVHKTVRARDIWNAIIESAWASAEPGVFFVDRYNKMSNSWYYAPILCTNPCHSGRNLVHTREGLIPIRDLAGREFDVVSDLRTLGGEGVHYERARAYPTGVKQLFKVTLDNGLAIELTENHRVFTQRGKVEVKDLRVGEDAVWIQSAPPVDALVESDEEELKIGRILGWNAGDGWISQFPDSHQGTCVNVGFIFNQEEILARDYVLEFVSETSSSPRAVTPRLNKRCWEVQSANSNLVDLFSRHGISPKQCKRVTAEIFSAPIKVRIGFLQGLFSADGSVDCYRNQSGANAVVLVTSHKALAYGVQLLLTDLGIKSWVRTRKAEGVPYVTKNGEQRISNANLAYSVRIGGEAIFRFHRLVGFPLSPRKQSQLEETVKALQSRRKEFRSEPYSKVVAIEPLGIEPVYNVTTEISHSLVVNGIVVANCGEQGLPAWGVCNLGAINLSKFVTNSDVNWDDLRTTVRYAVRFLDNVIDATPYFFEENKQQQLSERRVGLGTMGLAEMLIRLKLRYGSDEALQFIDKLYRFISTEAYLASCDLAVEKGPFERFDAEKFLQSGFMQGMPEEVRQAVQEKGIRNVTLLTQAPTGTTGTMVGTSTGIEPFYFWTYYRKSRLGVHEETVKIIEEWRRDHPNEPLPSYFVTAMDLAPEDHIRVEAAIQRWTDSSISKTCNIPAHYTVEQTRKLYELMYRLGCKGGTVYRDKSRDEQVLHLKESAQADASEPTVTVETQPHVRPRPYKRRGITVSKPTPAGTAHITMNDDDQGNPFEVFIEIGKAGSDLKAMAEAMGRLISLILRLASPVKPIERVREIVNQIRGIGGARALGFGKERVLSLPDAVGQALEEQYGVKAAENFHPPAVNAVAPSEPRRDMTLQADLCPSCGNATFVHQEGCTTCMTCGYSEC